MFYLGRAREALGQFMPNLAEKLQQYSLHEMESPGNPSIQDFKQFGGPRLLIPEQYSGFGATPLQACQVQQAIASYSPSLAVVAMMHHFSVAVLGEMANNRRSKTGVMLEMIARENLLLASAFSEGRSNACILQPFTRLTRKDGKFYVSGTKKPCSVAYSMDLLTLSVLVPGKHPDDDQLAVAAIPADAPGIERKPFWQSQILAGAESDEVVLNNVPLSEKAISYSGRPGELDSVQVGGFLWFVTMSISSYLGAAAVLADQVFSQQRGSATDRTRLAMDLEGANASMEGLAARLASETRSEDLLAHALLVRYSVQQALERSTMLAAELLGGINYMGSQDTAYLLSAIRALAFHPPSRGRMTEPLANYLSGQRLKFGESVPSRNAA